MFWNTGAPNFSLEVTCRAASFGTMRNAIHSTGLVHSVDCLRSRVPASQLQKHLYMQEPPALRQLGAKRRCLDSNSKHRSLLPCNARMYIMYCASMPEHVRMWSRIVCSTILQLSQQQLFTRFACSPPEPAPTELRPKQQTFSAACAHVTRTAPVCTCPGRVRVEAPGQPRGPVASESPTGHSAYAPPKPLKVP